MLKRNGTSISQSYKTWNLAKEVKINILLNGSLLIIQRYLSPQPAEIVNFRNIILGPNSIPFLVSKNGEVLYYNKGGPK